MFRLEAEPSSAPKGTVLIVHGWGGSPAGWIFVKNKDNDALPIALAKAGYDVWLGGLRGSDASPDHANRDDVDYWNFSWGEVGIYDLPSMVDYIYRSIG